MDTFKVTTAADNGSGSLRDAIALAKNGDRIVLSSQLQQKTIKLTSGQLVLNKNLTIDGSNAPGAVISGNNNSRVFYLNKKRRATLKNLTIADGKTNGAGGGIETRHESTLVLENVKVHNNRSALGGGMRLGHLAKATIINSSFKNNDGTLSNKYAGFSAGAISHNESRGQLAIKGTTFENNKGFNGGAIYSFSGVSFTVEDSVFQNNVAQRKGGGAIFTDGVSSKGYNSGLAGDGKIVIRGSQFKGNSAKGQGGALFLWGYNQKSGYKNDRAIIEDSLFVDNTISQSENGKAAGGAIWAKMGLDVRDVTFARNSATKQGGALWTETSLPVNIVNSTFSANRAVRDAGGATFFNQSAPVNITNSTIAYNEAGRANGALWFGRNHNVTLKNSIVAFNRAEQDRRQDQVGFHVKDGGGNLEFAGPRALTVIKNGTAIDPRIGTLAWVDGALIHPLLADSPAIDAGVSRGAPATDQRNIKRDSEIDVGASELQSSASGTKSNALTTKVNPGSVTYPSFDQFSNKAVEDRPAASRENPSKLFGDAVWTAGIADGAISFDGKSNAIKLNGSSDIDKGIHRKRTVSLWFKADSINTGSKRQVLYEEGGGARGLNMYIDRDKLYVGGWNRPRKESGWKGTWLSTDRISANKWHHVDLVLDGGSKVTKNAIVGYLDGQQFGSGSGSQLWSHASGTGVGSVNKGTRFHDGTFTASGSGFTGKVDEIAIFNKALTSTDVNAFL